MVNIMYDISQLTMQQKIIWNFIKNGREITQELIPSSIPKWKVFNAIANKIKYDGKPLGFILIDLNKISLHDMYYKTYNKKQEEIHVLADIFNLTQKRPCIVVFKNLAGSSGSYRDRMKIFAKEKRINNAHFPENTFLLIDY